MSDKISDETLKHFANDPMSNFLSLGDVMQLALELIARRAADAQDVRPVELPSRFKPVISSIIKDKPSRGAAMQLDNKNGGWLNRASVVAAIKAAGGSVEGEE